MLNNAYISKYWLLKTIFLKVNTCTSQYRYLTHKSTYNVNSNLIDYVFMYLLKQFIINMANKYYKHKSEMFMLCRIYTDTI